MRCLSLSCTHVTIKPKNKYFKKECVYLNILLFISPYILCVERERERERGGRESERDRKRKNARIDERERER